MTVYRTNVSTHQILKDGLPVWEEHGEKVVINGKEFVFVRGDVLLRMDASWHESPEAARVAAAAEVADLGVRLMAQSQRLLGGRDK
jgi:hypothetical protein